MITYVHGTMGSGKSLKLIATAHDYKQNGLTVLVFKHSLDTRDETRISTRAPLEMQAYTFCDCEDVENEIKNREGEVAAVFFDEANFFKPQDIEKLIALSYAYHIDFTFYGLKNTFQGELFPASKRLLELADKVHEYPSICSCGSGAKQNLRLVDGEPVFEGELIQIGGNESYKAVCNQCFAKLRKKIEQKLA